MKETGQQLFGPGSDAGTPQPASPEDSAASGEASTKAPAAPGGDGAPEAGSGSGGVGASASSPGDAGGGTVTQRDRGWSVVIANFPNTQEGRQRAQNALRQVRSRGELPEAHLEQRESRIVLGVGRFDAPDDPAAQKELDRVRGITVEEEQPYRSAVLGPPAPKRVHGSIPEYDLRNARERHGEDALYTLQIGVYGRPDRTETPDEEELREYRQAAEQAVVELREEGEKAFYYHGPRRSTVTLGIFGPEDHDPYEGLNAESQRLKEARQRHPHNLLNGQGIREKLPGRSGEDEEDFRLQPSRLVRIPE